MSNPFQPPSKPPSPPKPPGNGGKKSPVPPPLPNGPQAGKSVWMKCRANAGCEGNSCVFIRKFRLPSGGQSVRYRCSKCTGTFHITY